MSNRRFKLKTFQRKCVVICHYIAWICLSVQANISFFFFLKDRTFFYWYFKVSTNTEGIKQDCRLLWYNWISTLSCERNDFGVGKKHHHHALRDRWVQNLGCHEYDLERRVTTIVNWTRLGRAKIALGHIRGHSAPGTFLKWLVGD